MSVQKVILPDATQVLKGQLETVDELDAAIAAIPVNVDAGAASNEVAFTLTAILESLGVASDTLRVLYAVAEDAVLDLATNDEAIAETLTRFEEEVIPK